MNMIVSQVLGCENRGVYVLMSGLDIERVIVAVMAVGSSVSTRIMLDYTHLYMVHTSLVMTKWHWKTVVSWHVKCLQ